MNKRGLVAASAVIASLSLALSACGSTGSEEEPEAPAAKTSLTVGWNQPFYSYNENTTNGNATANANVKYLTVGSFWYYDTEQVLHHDESYGHYEKVSDEPLTVKYTFGDDTTWSDGTPTDATDFLLWWAAGGGHLNSVSGDDVTYDEETGALVQPEGEVFFDTSDSGLALVTKQPEISDDGKSITLVYDKPYADWELVGGGNVPAHVVAKKALGITDNAEAKQAIIDAITNNDKESLAKISAFWNSGFDYTSLPDDPDLYLSNGAYTIKEFVENEYITLEKNADFKGEFAAKIDTLTIRYNEDPLAQVQALANGEISIFSPQVTVDVVDAAKQNPNAEIITGVEGTYEHVDLVLNNGGPFDPASYGGDAEKAKAVRTAFLTAYPRQEIVDKLIKPIAPDAEIRQSFNKTPGAPGYDSSVAASGIESKFTGDAAAAKAILDGAGITQPVEVEVLFAEGNVRRENEFEIIKPALEAAGFSLVDERSAEWGSKLGDGSYDAAYFAWQSTSTAVSADQALWGTNQINNMIGYSNKDADTLLDELVITPDQTRQLEINDELEKILVDDAVGAPIFQFPSATIYDKTKVSGVNPAPLSPTMFYGFWDWEVVS